MALRGNLPFHVLLAFWALVVPRIPLHGNFIQGMSRSASRRFDLSDAALLATLNSHAPHSQPWQMLHLSPDMRLRLTTDLQRQRLAWSSLASVPAPKTDFGPTIGYHSQTPWAWTRFCRPWTTRSPSSVSLPTGSAMAAPAEVVTQSVLNAYATRSWPSRRSSPQWASRIPGSRLFDTWTRD